MGMKQEAMEHLRKRLAERDKFNKMEALNILYGWFETDGISLTDALDAVDELAMNGEIDF